MSTEKSLQKYVIKKLKGAGCFVGKVNMAGKRGFPDLYVRTRKKHFLIEMKHPGGTGRLSAHQHKVIAELQALGQCVNVIDNKEQFDVLLEMIARGQM